MNGTTRAAGLIETYVSSTVVSTCTTTNATTSSERFRCRPAVMTRGQRGEDSRETPAMPSATVAVSSSSAITPVARVAYQSGLGPDVPASRCAGGTAATASLAGWLAVPSIAQDPPEETGACAGAGAAWGCRRGGVRRPC